MLQRCGSTTSHNEINWDARMMPASISILSALAANRYRGRNRGLLHGSMTMIRAPSMCWMGGPVNDDRSWARGLLPFICFYVYTHMVTVIVVIILRQPHELHYVIRMLAPLDVCISLWLVHIPVLCWLNVLRY